VVKPPASANQANPSKWDQGPPEGLRGDADGPPENKTKPEVWKQLAALLKQVAVEVPGMAELIPGVQAQIDRNGPKPDQAELTKQLQRVSQKLRSREKERDKTAEALEYHRHMLGELEEKELALQAEVEDLKAEWAQASRRAAEMGATDRAADGGGAQTAPDGAPPGGADRTAPASPQGTQEVKPEPATPAGGGSSGQKGTPKKEGPERSRSPAQAHKGKKPRTEEDEMRTDG
jgi:hypothetical protein